jgi:3-keto-L-gulonate-6-phosphate decarboxylase
LRWITKRCPAYETTRLIAEEVDIIEVGTILCVARAYAPFAT